MKKENIIAGISLGSAVVIGYFIYTAVSSYKTNKRIESIDKNIAKLSGGTPYDGKILS